MTIVSQRQRDMPSLEERRANAISMRQTVEARIRTFEGRFGMTSTEMRRRLNDGEIEEDDDICQWLMELHVLAALNRAR